MRRLPWLVIALAVAGIDLFSKSAAFASLNEGETEWVFGQWFGLTEVLNPGIVLLLVHFATTTLYGNLSIIFLALGQLVR